MLFKKTVARLHWLLSSQFGLNFYTFMRSFLRLPAYFRDWLVFRRSFVGKMEFAPCLHDRYEEGGATKSEYFWQDLLVARAICAAEPEKHVDIGSRVDGFVAHVASFRDCEVFDVRPINSIVPGVLFRQADLMNMLSLPIAPGDGYCDSLSCLHAVEHFGLGRYGDPLNPKGYQLGISNMSRLLKIGGILYLSAPIGIERVEFNANWVFDPHTIVSCAEAVGLILKKIVVIDPITGPQEVVSNFEPILIDLAVQQYMLCLFVFEKN